MCIIRKSINWYFLYDVTWLNDREAYRMRACCCKHIPSFDTTKYLCRQAQTRIKHNYMLISAYITTTSIFPHKIYTRRYSRPGYILCELNAQAYYKILCDVCVCSIYVILGK